MVDFDPGRMTSRHRPAPAGAGRRRRGRRRARAAADRNRRSWRCADRRARRCECGHRRLPPSGPAGSTASSAGSRCAASKNGTRPSAGQPVRSLTVFMPSSNSVGSPRKRLTMKPTIIAASAASITALVPTRLAITPPRSMSPTSTTGTSAARAKPMLAMSLGAQVDLGRRARAFDQHEIALGREASEAVEHGAQQLGLQSLILARLGVADDLALHHDLRADIALGLQQHRVHVHAERHARGARLQRLGAADLAAVGGDRGVVRHVLRLERAHTKAAAREGARQSRDQQRLADVRARALDHDGAGGHQNSMPSCAFTPAAKWCFTRVISVTRSAASISSGLALRPVTTTCWSARRAFSTATTSSMSKMVVAQRDVELVEHDQADRRVGHQFARLGPGALGRGDVARAILRLPGEAFAQRVPFDLIAEALQRGALAGLPGALAELHDAAAQAAAQRAHQQAPGGRRLALALAGVDDQQAFLDGLGGDLGILRGLAVGHFRLVAGGFIGFCRHGRTMGVPDAAFKTTRIPLPDSH